MRQYLPVALAAALILLGGTVHGYRTNRWGLPPDLQRSAERLPDLPLVIGDWEGREIPAGEALTRAAENGDISAFLQRHYVNRQTGESVTVFLALGLTGAMVTHDPRACYGGGGIYQDGPLSRESIPAGNGNEPATFLVGNFRPINSANPMGVQIHWSFRGGQRWEASEDPRVDFAAHRALYKIYLLREFAMTTEEPASAQQDEATLPFARQLLPAIEQAVFRASDASDSAASISTRSEWAEDGVAVTHRDPARPLIAPPAAM